MTISANNSNSTNFHYFYGFAKLYGFIIYQIVFLLITLWILVVNSLILILVSKTVSLHTTTFYGLSSLAVADLITAFGGILNRLIIPLIWDPHDTSICLYIYIIYIFPISVSSYHLTYIALERYWAITSPLKYSVYMTPKKLLIALIVIWTENISFKIILPIFWNNKDKVAVDNIHDCPFLILSNMYLLLIIVGTSILQHVLIYSMYGHIFYISRNHQQKLKNLKQR